MKKIILTLLLMAIYFAGQSQDSVILGPSKKNAIYGELCGASWTGTSLNYERTIVKLGLVRFTGRLGVGFYFPDFEIRVGGSGKNEEEAIALILPTTLSVVIGQTHGLELGGGASFGTRKDEDYYDGLKWINLLAGYRLQSKGGFMLRVLYSPIMQFHNACEDSDCTKTYRTTQVSNFFGVSVGSMF